MRKPAKSANQLINRRSIAYICERNDVAYLGVFGSFARGEATASSDVDLLVRFAQPKSLLDLVRIEREFADRLGRPVDLVIEEAISPYLRERILGEVREIYEQP